ncbi:hypothetical protein LR48_Vigan11g026800 [Vigna angularis]|uniref:Uncharacterized protein n=1 Tax=Phaseolus angularis TaxID=3914 RepID=A0A0L9VQ90_PHAAN|nr:hypothetical protein LR48_Vigan11g026800 [Vigna angularis]
MIRNHKKPRRAFGLDITISDQHQKLSTKSKLFYVKDRAVNPSRKRGKALSKPNGKARSLGSTPRSKQRGKALSKPNGKARSLGSTPSSKQRGKSLSKPNDKARSLGSTPRSKQRGKALSVNVEDREVNSSRFLLKDERTSGKSRSVNVEGRAVNPARVMSKVERSSGKTLSVLQTQPPSNSSVL